LWLAVMDGGDIITSGNLAPEVIKTAIIKKLIE
jgi:hypothetical protein